MPNQKYRATKTIETKISPDITIYITIMSHLSPKFESNCRIKIFLLCFVAFFVCYCWIVIILYRGVDYVREYTDYMEYHNHMRIDGRGDAQNHYRNKNNFPLYYNLSSSKNSHSFVWYAVLWFCCVYCARKWKTNAKFNWCWFFY